MKKYIAGEELGIILSPKASMEGAKCRDYIGGPAEGGGESYTDAYADADTIPRMTPITERERGKLGIFPSTEASTERSSEFFKVPKPI